MVAVSRTFTVPVPQEVAVDYLKDFSNAEEWDPGTERCTRVDPGPVTVGSRWRNVSRILGRRTELDYRLVELRPDGLVLEGRNRTATSVDDIRVVDGHGSSEVTYRADITFHGLAKVASPLMRLVFERLATGVQRQLTEALTRRGARQG